jgi:hypothetical protein
MVVVTSTKPDRRRGRRQVSNEASWVNEWLESGRPKAVRRSVVREGREEVQGLSRRMSSREAVSLK